MKPNEAKTLVDNTFNDAYDEGRFRYFIRNLFTDLEEKSDRWAGSYVPEAFRAYVSQYGRVGKLEDPEGYTVDVLAVKLKSASQLERARSAQRNFVARYLNGGRGGQLRDAALVAFYADDADDWRFSLVRMDYTIDPEAGKVRKELTPARRYSFLVGPSERTHTARQQLSKVLIGGAKTTLGDLEDAFNIETVTKEFFEKYKGLFLDLKEALDTLADKHARIKQEFETKEIDTANFAKRLLGQVVFLYFLQKKGWLGVERGAVWGTGPKDFLQQLLEGNIIDYRNFFDDILEPLFYDALANLAKEHDDNFVPHFKRRVPFLNGGLFEPIGGYDWVNVDIPLSNDLFSDIFGVFDLYNFTVREDEPLDKEVAVDPEMLGKVFENLLEVTDRKSKGAFYTPREIVHYMCQESLINYLDTTLNTVKRPLQKQAPTQDDLFGRPQTRQEPLYEEVYEERTPRQDIEAFIRLGDIAQEHDATTMQKGRETKDYRFKIPESIRQRAKDIDDALATIKICDPAIGSGAFPVGMMNEIVRARSALNAYLVGESRSAYAFKRHAIQESIYGVDVDASAVDIAKLRLWLSLVVDEDDFGTIKPLPNLEYKIVVGNSLLGVEETLFNNEAFEKLERLQHDYINETRSSQKRSLKNQIDTLIGELTNDSERFDFKIYFSEVFRQQGGFDIVIGNPPYVDSENMVKNNPEERKLIADNYATAKGNWDLYIPFWELSLKLNHNLGITTLITPNKWLSIGYGKKLREFAKSYVYELVDYSRFRAFENVGVFPVVLIMNKAGHDCFRIKRFNNHHHLTYMVTLDLSTLGKFDKWGLFLSESLDLIKELIDDNKRLGGFCSIEEPFTVSEAYELVPLLQEEQEAKGDYFKFANTGTIDPYIALWGEKKTTYLKQKYEKPVLGKDKFKKLFERRFFQTTREKILISGMRHFEAFLDEAGEWVSGKSTVIISKFAPNLPPKFLLGILNSKLVTFYLRECFGSLGMDGGINFSPSNVSEIPIRTIDFSDPLDKQKHDSMVERVEAMLSLHEQKVAAKDQGERARLEREIAATDKQIDALVYELYDLTEEETAVVEESVAR